MGTIGLEAARRAGERFGEALALSHLGSAYHDRGEYETAVDYHQAHFNLGKALRELGLVDEAISSFERAAACFRDIESDYQLAYALNEIAECCRCVGDVAGAEAHLLTALNLRRKLKDRWGEAISLQTLGHALLDGGHRDSARERLTEALMIFEELEQNESSTEHLSDVSELLARL